MTKYYKIAGLTVAMDTFGRTEEQAVPYQIEIYDTPDIIISSNWRDFQQKNPHLSEEDSEYLMTGADFYRKLLTFDGMLLHSSAVVRDGKAYLFTAACGTGKSTHTHLWLENFPDAYILNDDKPALRLEEEQFYAYGTPWSGKYDISKNIRVPLAGICVLYRGTENKIEHYREKNALHAILEQTMRPNNPQLLGQLLELLDKLLLQVPIWRLECNMEPEAALVSYRAMSEKTREEIKK